VNAGSAAICCEAKKGLGWGYKDLEASSGPFFYSCPSKYLDFVPIEKFGGSAVSPAPKLKKRAL